MARVSTYVNFLGNTQEALDFYKDIFGTDYVGPILRMGDAPSQPGMPELSDSDKQMILHAELPILAGHLLMATDMVESMGHELVVGNNTTIHLEPDTLEEAQRLYDAISEGGSEEAPLALMFWGAYWGTCLDRFGIRWMFSFYPEGYDPAAPPA